MVGDHPDVDVIYLSPRGKRCVLVPLGSKLWLYFRYLDDATLAGDGFPLSRANFGLMRRAPTQWAAFQRQRTTEACDAA